ncbi:hypothetical protein DS885_05520 [Psychromonas sp. B3M02]|nr:hypothetical protein DS885_05520 [Psychromonas sp. B3M02]
MITVFLEPFTLNLEKEVSVLRFKMQGARHKVITVFLEPFNFYLEPCLLNLESLTKNTILSSKGSNKIWKNETY